MMRDTNREAHLTLDSFNVAKAAPTAFTGGTADTRGNQAGTANPTTLFTVTGEVLVQDTVDANIDLGMVGATFNDIFRTAHEASIKIGLDACKESVISTPKGVIIMRCSGVKAKVHYHSIVIMTVDGNQALAKMEMEKMVPKVMEELA